MYLPSKTIAAIATAAGGGIGIIRVSGPQAQEICRRVCSPVPPAAVSHHLYLGRVIDPEGGEILDQVLFCLMRAPQSYTGEDVLEIHAHGGRINLERILGAILRAGASAAEPGEFTKRGFYNGKLDLTRAEALADLIGAQTVRSARQAQRQLAGDLRTTLRELWKRTIKVLGEVEGRMDFPDLGPELTSETPNHRFSSMRVEVEEIAGEIRSLSEGFCNGGRVLHTGIEIAFIGQTNVGKSSLINSLCSEERLLVYAQPGTTRDYVEVRMAWQGIPVLLVDTAGERPDTTDIERLGLCLAQERQRRADLLMLVIDGTLGMTPQEQRMFEEEPDRCIVVWNKIDQENCLEPKSQKRIVPCSALCGWGLDRLKRDAIEVIAPHIEAEDKLIVTSERQARLLDQALFCLDEVRCALRQERTDDVIAANLRIAAEAVGAITGQEAVLAPEVIDSIFAQLCIGK